MVRHTAPFFAVAAGLIAAVSLLDAQEVRATLGGRVTDAQGAVVPNAAVTIISEETNVEQHTRSNPQGNWTMQFMQPGTYRFTISAQGFKTARSGHIELQAADVKQIDTRLELGSTRESVAVTAEVPLIDTTSATSGTVISQQEIEEIPSMTHISTLLDHALAGVIAQDQNNNVGHLWSYNAASQFTANGGRNNIYSNMFLLDGFPNIKSGGNIAFNPSPDTLADSLLLIGPRSRNPPAIISGREISRAATISPASTNRWGSITYGFLTRIACLISALELRASKKARAMLAQVSTSRS
jgi:hypothetical protein